MGTETGLPLGPDVSRILVIDLEATCWEGDPPPGQEAEIIEIGSAVLCTADLHVEPGPELLVRPTRSTVSAFCTDLTTLTGDVLERQGVSFSEALAVLSRTYGTLAETVWASYGNYDRRMLQAECERYGLPFPLGQTHLNVKQLVAFTAGWRREVGMRQALKRLGLQPTPGAVHHRGADDAAEIARILGLVLRGLKS